MREKIKYIHCLQIYIPKMAAAHNDECKWLECGNTNSKMSMSMMVPDEVDMEHEVVKCSMCIVKEMHVAKREEELLRKEVGKLRVQSMNKDKEVAEVKTKEEDSWAIVGS